MERYLDSLFQDFNMLQMKIMAATAIPMVGLHLVGVIEMSEEFQGRLARMPMMLLQLYGTIKCIEKYPVFKYYLIIFLSTVMYAVFLETIFDQSFIGRFLSAATILQSEHLLYRFARFNKSTLIVIYVLKLGYTVGRVHYEFKDKDENLMHPEDIFNLLVLTTFYAYTLYIDDQVSSFI